MSDKTILYLEDNEDNAYMLSRRLEKRGFQVTVASDGEAGVAAAQKILPTLILMDLNLPVMDGWAAAKLLRSIESTSRIPIIAVSSHVLPEAREIALSAGCDAYETKPIDFHNLIKTIHRLTDNSAT